MTWREDHVQAERELGVDGADPRAVAHHKHPFEPVDQVTRGVPLHPLRVCPGFRGNQLMFPCLPPACSDFSASDLGGGQKGAHGGVATPSNA